MLLKMWDLTGGGVKYSGFGRSNIPGFIPDIPGLPIPVYSGIFWAVFTPQLISIKIQHRAKLQAKVQQPWALWQLPDWLQ